MFSWKLNPKTLSDAQNTSTLRLASQKAAFSHHWQRADNSRKDPLLSQASHIPAPTSRHPQRACLRLALSPYIAMRPLGREREAAGEGPPHKENPCLFKGPVFLWPKKSLPHGFPGLEITCTVSHSHLVWCFGFLKDSLFLKRKGKGASDVYFCSNSGETADSTCFSFAAHSKQLPRGSGQRKGGAREKGTQLSSQLPRGNHLELRRNACVSQESLYIS